MKYSGKARLRRAIAFILTWAMLLCGMTVPAMAQEDWQQLSIALSWVDVAGSSSVVTALPVTWGTEQAFWATVDASAPLDGLTLTISHPMHSYTFAPADGSQLTGVIDAGGAMDPLNAVVITAYDETGTPVDMYNLYISTQLVPEEPTEAPTEPPVASVTVQYLLTDGTVLDQQETQCQNGQVVVASSAAVAGLIPTSAQEITVTVDENGNASPNPVTFYYEAPAPTEPPVANVTVQYLLTDGTLLDQQETQCQNGQVVVASSAAVAGLIPTSAQEITVTVDENGNASPNPVTFYYEAPAPTEPPVANVTVQYLLTDGTVLDQQETQCQNGQVVVASSGAVAGLIPTSAQEITVTVDENGNASPNPVTFYYEAPAPTEPPITEAPVTEPPATEAPATDVPATEAPATDGPVVQKATIEIYYLDSQTGIEVASFTSRTLTDGDYVIVPEPADLMPGYTLDPNYPQSANVHVANGMAEPFTLTFFYLPETIATDVPATEIPATDAPVTEAPVTEPPVTEAPATDVPVLDATINVYYRNQRNVDIAGPFTMTLPGNQISIVAPEPDVVPARYDASSASYVPVEVSADGVATPAEVVFTFTELVVETPIPMGEMINRYGVINDTQVAWRNLPADEKGSTVLGRLSKGTYVWMIQEQLSQSGDAWTRVLVKGQEAFIKSEFLTALTQAESDAYLAQQGATMPPPGQPSIAPATDAPATEPPVTDAPATEPPATDAPATDIPATDAPATDAPVTDAPVTEEPEQYTGYALTNRTVALRTGISNADEAIIARLEANELLMVSGQGYEQGTGASWSIVSTLAGVSGMVPDSALTRINPQEAQYYLDLWAEAHATPTPNATPTATVEPPQVSGYAMTIGDNVYFRNMPSTTSDILDVLRQGAVMYVNGQQYVDGVAWHIVQYNSQWGYIRADMLRFMTQAEVQAYLNSQATPAPTLITTPQPYDPNGLSSYGYVTSSTVNFRTGASTSSSRIAVLRQYAMCLVLGTTQVNGTTWYHVRYNNQDGYLSGEYFRQMSIAEWEEFLTSSEYQQGIVNNSQTNNNNNTGSTGSNGTNGGVVSPEDQTVSTWTNPNNGLSVSYQPFDPFATPAPIEQDTVSPTETASPTVSPTIAPLPTVQLPYEQEEKGGGSAIGWIIGIILLLFIGGGGYAYVLYRQNKRRIAAQRAAQRRAQAMQQHRSPDDRNGAPTANAPRTGTYVNQGGQPQARRPYNAGANGQSAQYGQQPMRPPMTGTRPTDGTPYGTSAGTPTDHRQPSAYARPTSQPSPYERPQNANNNASYRQPEDREPRPSARYTPNRRANRMKYDQDQPEDRNGDFSDGHDQGDF